MSNYRTISLDHYATIFKALSNPHRLQIFNILTGCCEPGTLCSTDEMMSCCVGDLDSQLNIASSTLSHHLKELHHAGLIEMQRNGKQVLCSINPATLAEVAALFSSARTTQN
ncbi:MAG: metalloregulator ArsR/SmtB family transcription factor [Gammaproteobacteria bacterium]|nr:metalloregulator ArsR/SmtB family transcription factor [Gammaproteobacteria bacterium]